MAQDDDLIGRYLIDSTHEHERSLGVVCPGCRETHYIRIWQDGTLHPDTPVWTFNDNPEAPTFRPSLLVRTYRYPKNATPEDDAEFDRVQAQGFDALCASRFGVCCHSFVTDGRWQFLDDCTHDLKGQTVPMVDVAQWRSEREARYAAALALNLQANTPAVKPAPGAVPPPGNGQWRAI